MSNALFDAGREGILDGTISVSVASIKVALVRGYTFSAAHKFVSDITGAGGTLAASADAALSSKTETGGVFNAGSATWTAPAANANNHYLLIYQSSAVTGGADVAATAQRVIAYIDTGTNLPVILNGGNITVTWDTGSNKIFKL